MACLSAFPYGYASASNECGEHAFIFYRQRLLKKMRSVAMKKKAKCPCERVICVADDVKLLKTRQRYAELEIIRLKKILTKCLKVNLEEDSP